MKTVKRFLKKASVVVAVVCLTFGITAWYGTIMNDGRNFTPVSEQQKEMTSLSDATFTVEQMNELSNLLTPEEVESINQTFGSATQKEYIRAFYEVKPDAVADKLGEYGVCID